MSNNQIIFLSNHFQASDGIRHHRRVYKDFRSKVKVNIDLMSVEPCKHDILETACLAQSHSDVTYT